MSEKRYTEGPWESDGPAEFFPSIISPELDLIATVYHSDNDGEDNLTVSDCEANAQLIAAAPELLEALENCKGFLDNPVMRRRNQSDSFYRETIKSINSAIEKAKGDI